MIPYLSLICAIFIIKYKVYYKKNDTITKKQKEKLVEREKKDLETSFLLQVSLELKSLTHPLFQPRYVTQHRSLC